MVDVACSHNDDVVSEIVGVVEVSDVISSQALELISVTVDWLTKHVLSVNVEMSVIDQSFKVSVVAIFMVLVDFFLDTFKFTSIESAVADDITEEFDSSANITLENLETELTDFSTSISMNSCSHAFDFFADVCL
jgi:hypothetical protein